MKNSYLFLMNVLTTVFYESSVKYSYQNNCTWLKNGPISLEKLYTSQKRLFN